MSRVEESIDVDVPVRVAYNQWTQFEAFPQFMEGVKQVVQLDDTRLRWTAEIAGREKTWEAKISRQEPDRAIAWHSTEGAPNRGGVMFEELGPTQSRVNLTLDYDPEGPIESAGDVLGLVERRVKGDLERFKTLIESLGQETGAWRGEVRAGDTVGDSGSPGH